MGGLSGGYTISEAFQAIREEVGEWDPMYKNYSLAQAYFYHVAFPILVSEDDPYSVDISPIQYEAKCNWKLPQKPASDPYRTWTDKTITKGNEYDIEALELYSAVQNIEKTGDLPAGMRWKITSGILHFYGTPTSKGISDSQFLITYRDGSVHTHNVRLMVMDNKTTRSTTQNITITTDKDEKWTSSAYLKNGTSYYYGLSFASDDMTYAMTKVDGWLPFSLTYGFSDGDRGYIRSTRHSLYPDYYNAVPPGNYSIKLKIVSFSGSVYMHTVNITVNPADSYTIPNAVVIHATQYENTGENIGRGDFMTAEGWTAGAVVKVEELEGSLPRGMIIANSFDQPFGVYGAPQEAGTFTKKCRIYTYYASYEYTFRVYVKARLGVSFDANGGTGSMPAVGFVSGDSYKLPDCDFTPPAGYKFKKWDKGNPGDVITVTEDITLKAIWDAEPYYKVSVISGSADRTAAPKGQPVSIKASERENCAFTSWTVVSGNAVLKNTNSSETSFTMPAEDVEIKANYKYTGSTLTTFYVYVTMPVDGAYPQNAAVITDNYRVTDTAWIDKKTNEKLKSTDAFQAGNTYEVQVHLSPSSTPVDPAFNAYVNDSMKNVSCTYKGMAVAMVAKEFTATVPVKPDSITLNRSKAEIATTKTLQLKASILPIDAADKTLTWTSSDSKVASVDSNGKVTAKQYGTATITAKTSNGKKAVCKVQTRFYDVNDSGRSYYNAVYWAVDQGITRCSVNFRPDDGVTRGEFTAFLYRMAGSPKVTKYAADFKDVNSDTKFYKEISWAVNKGIIQGFKDKTFRPNDGLTRGQAAIMIWRYAGRPSVSTKTSPFKDIAPKDSDTCKAILWGYKNDIIKGYTEGTTKVFKKDQSCTRANVVTFLYRYKQKFD